MKRKHRNTLLLALALTTLPGASRADSVLNHLCDTIEFRNESTGMFGGGDFAPYWMTNNHYGLSTEETNAFIWRRSLRHEMDNSDRKWKAGWGLEVSNVVTKKWDWIVQELYFDIQYKKVRLSVGQKERPLEFLNSELSSGGMASGINARPIPQVRIDVPDFWTIPGTRGWLALRGHIGYGMYTDNSWQKDFAGNANKLYSQNSLYHTKAGFVRVGNTKKFPVTLTGGLEMNTQFCGTTYTAGNGSTIHMPTKLSSFWNVFIPGGSDPTDGMYPNKEGNTVGAWHFVMEYRANEDSPKKAWGAKLYAQHVFEDESQMFWQYGWKDIMMGAEFNLPKNPVVSTVLYEYLTSKDQSGPIYHDKTQQIPDQISAVDNYYNHGLYGAWQHAGFGMGNGLFISPRYNAEHTISMKHNRIQAHHLGISGQPLKGLDYKILFSYEKSWGTYSAPLVDPQEGWTVLVQATYMPTWLRNCGVKLAYGHNGGKLLGNSNGMQAGFLYKVKLHTK